jgi:hypothetical protein
LTFDDTEWHISQKTFASCINLVEIKPMPEVQKVTLIVEKKAF